MDWKQLEAECRQCKKCALWESRTNVVFGTGNPKAEILFIGEGPGENEDKQGKPFVGRAGKLLDDMLELIGLSREDNIYIANTVKCRPPGNRDPLNSEKEACYNWLKGQIELISPKIIVCLGRIAAMTMLDPDFKISREHGKWYDLDGIRAMAIYHPAALLRDPRRRPETFEDLQNLREAIKVHCPGTRLNKIPGAELF